MAQLLAPREDDALVPAGQTSSALRSFAVLPAFDDLPLTVALEHRGVSSHPVDDESAMLRCLSVELLANRLDISLLPGEGDSPFLTRILPRDSFVFWPADRF